MGLGAETGCRNFNCWRWFLGRNKKTVAINTNYSLHVLFFVHGSGGFDGYGDDELWVQEALLGAPCSAFSPSFLSAMKWHSSFSIVLASQLNPGSTTTGTTSAEMPDPAGENQSLAPDDAECCS